MVGPVTLNGPGDRCFWSWWPFLRLINLRDLNKYKFNRKTRSIHVFTFRETQDPDRLDTFDFVKLTLKIITKISDHSVEKQKSYAILNDRLETFDLYSIWLANNIC
jgi:hypothetical protein